MRRRTAALLLIICGLLVPGLAAQDKSAVVAGEVGQRIDRYLTKAVANGYAGSVLVARNERIILAKGYGLADREAKVAETPETVFSIGSITKQFTGAAILKLEMMGRLSVNDPITKYLPGVPEDKKGVTLHQLLTHCAGLADSLGDDYETVGREEFIKLALASKLLSKPGEQYHYSNVGFSLLGIIVELVSGKGYETFLYENIFKPAGMERTGYVRPRFAKSELAVGYTGDSRWGTALDRAWLADGPGWHLRANGGILSTVGDMYRWYLALKKDAVLSASAKKKYFAPHVRETPGGDSFYGYGWVTQKKDPQTTLIWHNGGNGVYNAFMGFQPEKDLVVIVSSNCAGKISDDYARRIDRIVAGDALELDEQALTDWSGIYRLASGVRILVRFDEQDNLIAAYQAKELFNWLTASGKEDPEVAARFDQRVRNLILTALAGDYAALAEAWGEPLAEIKSRAPMFWGALEKNNGKYKGLEILGTASRPANFLTCARLDFEVKKLCLTFVWEGDRLTDLRRTVMLDRSFEPRSATEFFAPTIGATILLQKDDQGQKVMVIKTSRGAELRATRSHPEKADDPDK